MYLLIIQDRHYDDEYQLFTDSESAVKEARNRVDNWPRFYNWEYFEPDEEWPFLAEASGGDYSVTVRQVDDPLRGGK